MQVQMYSEHQVSHLATGCTHMDGKRVKNNKRGRKGTRTTYNAITTCQPGSPFAKMLFHFQQKRKQGSWIKYVCGYNTIKQALRENLRISVCCQVAIFVFISATHHRLSWNSFSQKICEVNRKLMCDCLSADMKPFRKQFVTRITKAAHQTSPFKLRERHCLKLLTGLYSFFVQFLRQKAATLFQFQWYSQQQLFLQVIETPHVWISQIVGPMISKLNLRDPRSRTDDGICLELVKHTHKHTVLQFCWMGWCHVPNTFCCLRTSKQLVDATELSM